MSGAWPIRYGFPLAERALSGCERGHLPLGVRKNRIRVLAGDRVLVVMTPYDPSKGRTSYRFK
jgi:hypothetical protein